ncbi:cytidine deaminase [Dorea sp. D27]|uniref:cytidine deaminase n=1 Tax=Dorea sp. D27 TaxID=658665 RepID=UPI0011CA9DCF
MIQKAEEALGFSYAPYSHFKVAASLLTASGTVYTGCNIENAAYSPGNCAERTAMFKAVSEGERDFSAICIVNEDAEGGHGICPPCGVCRQVMMEFCRPDDFYIILAADEAHYEIYTLEELLPLGFGPGNLEG